MRGDSLYFITLCPRCYPGAAAIFFNVAQYGVGSNYFDRIRGIRLLVGINVKTGDRIYSTDDKEKMVLLI